MCEHFVVVILKFSMVYYYLQATDDSGEDTTHEQASLLLAKKSKQTKSKRRSKTSKPGPALPLKKRKKAALSSYSKTEISADSDKENMDSEELSQIPGFLENTTDVFDSGYHSTTTRLPATCPYPAHVEALHTCALGSGENHRPCTKNCLEELRVHI